MLKVLDLFSGIGGFSLGLERTGGFETVAFCEIEPYCQRVLAKHWPEVPCFPDITKLRGEDVGPVDVVCGGPPCQRTSIAAAIHGKRTGETKWPWMLRVICQLRPEWAIIEQPTKNKKWETQVAGDLAGIGYEVARFQRSARLHCAPHSRERVFFVANAMCERCDQVARIVRSSKTQEKPWPAPPRGTWRTSAAADRRMDDGFSDWVDRLTALGNAVVPQTPELIGNAIKQVAKIR